MEALLQGARCVVVTLSGEAVLEAPLGQLVREVRRDVARRLRVDVHCVHLVAEDQAMDDEAALPGLLTVVLNTAFRLDCCLCLERIECCCDRLVCDCTPSDASELCRTCQELLDGHEQPVAEQSSWAESCTVCGALRCICPLRRRRRRRSKPWTARVLPAIPEDE